eukprot:9466257-Pyramimonas_sp.AAC.1
MSNSWARQRQREYMWQLKWRRQTGHRMRTTPGAMLNVRAILGSLSLTTNLLRGFRGSWGARGRAAGALLWALRRRLLGSPHLRRRRARPARLSTLTAAARVATLIG